MFRGTIVGYNFVTNYCDSEVTILLSHEVLGVTIFLSHDFVRLI